MRVTSLVTKETLDEVFDTVFADTRDNWRSLCPFHSESTPSFYIHREDLVGHCFGCGIAGRLDVLVAKYHHTSPAKARKLLGLESLPWLDREYIPEPEPIYPNSWIHAWRRISNHPYLRSRGFEDQTIETFEVRWDNETKRAVFPLHLSNGKIGGAVGRSTDGREPKYYFYWNCDKGREVWTAPPFWVDKQGSIIVVEGILDCMWLWQNGFKHAVALIGASATISQLRTLREADKVIIALDNDKAGRNGGELIETALKGSCYIEYICYPDHAKDANDLSSDEITEVFTNPITPLEMKLRW